VVDARKRAGIVNIVAGLLMTAFFLFGLGLAWLVPALVADPVKILDILARFSAGELVLLGLVGFIFFLGLFTIYRGVSILTGWRFMDAVRTLFGTGKGVAGRTDR